MAEIKAVADEIERLWKVEREYERYREVVRTIISDRIEILRKGGFPFGEQYTYAVVSSLRSILRRIERI
ncbi:MAG: hypothetical protein KAX38_06375 [Candidatus Krumholzibacteria bacterium]|nr:hypothetical protein [Candidatus Krumholzibacteria bacterium]